MSFTGVTLTGRVVCLEPLTEPHREGLRRAANDPRIWVNTLTRGDGAEFDAMFDTALAERQAGTRIPFAVRRWTDDQLLGSTSYLDVNEKHRRVEIGSTWYHPDVWGTSINPECKLLLLQHAFEVFRVNRVALVTDLRNERSRAAIARLGAVQEGILRGHMVTQGGRVRDSVVFSIIAAEWPAVRARLLARLS
jgi:RimJ/RimL family protein N-acetyltransferase